MATHDWEKANGERMMDKLVGMTIRLGEAVLAAGGPALPEQRVVDGVPVSKTPAQWAVDGLTRLVVDKWTEMVNRQRSPNTNPVSVAEQVEQMAHVLRLLQQGNDPVDIEAIVLEDLLKAEEAEHVAKVA